MINSRQFKIKHLVMMTTAYAFAVSLIRLEFTLGLTAVILISGAVAGQMMMWISVLIDSNEEFEERSFQSQIFGSSGVIMFSLFGSLAVMMFSLLCFAAIVEAIT